MFGILRFRAPDRSQLFNRLPAPHSLFSKCHVRQVSMPLDQTAEAIGAHLRNRNSSQLPKVAPHRNTGDHIDARKTRPRAATSQPLTSVKF
jgi:hypothetical protein